MATAKVAVLAIPIMTAWLFIFKSGAVVALNRRHVIPSVIVAAEVETERRIKTYRDVLSPMILNLPIVSDMWHLGHNPLLSLNGNFVCILHGSAIGVIRTSNYELTAACLFMLSSTIFKAQAHVHAHAFRTVDKKNRTSLQYQFALIRLWRYKEKSNSSGWKWWHLLSISGVTQSS